MTKKEMNYRQRFGVPADHVPLLDLSRQYATLKEEMDAAVRAVSDSGRFVLGPEVTRLEAAIAERSKVTYGIGCASGSDALLLALMAAGVGPGDEVIVPSFTFFATASCVPRLGAVPLFADIDPVTFNIDPDCVEKLITPRTKAIIPVHLYGQLANMKALRRMTKEHANPERQKIVLIEDAAQAIGAQLDSIPAGGWGDMTCLSFYPTKNLGGAGDGGMVITNDETFARQVRLLRGHGMEPRYYHKVIGINSRLDSWQAAILNVKLPHLDSWVHMRQQNAKYYQEMFEEAGLDRVIGLPTTLEDRYHVWNQYVIRIPGGLRDGLRAALNEKKIGTDIYYPMGLHQQECFAYLKYQAEDLPETIRASREVLALPIFPELRPEEQWTVVCAIGEYLSAQGVF